MIKIKKKRNKKRKKKNKNEIKEDKKDENEDDIREKERKDEKDFVVSVFGSRSGGLRQGVGPCFGREGDGQADDVRDQCPADQGGEDPLG
jgi:hypothetical protein